MNYRAEGVVLTECVPSRAGGQNQICKRSTHAVGFCECTSLLAIARGVIYYSFSCPSCSSQWIKWQMKRIHSWEVGGAICKNSEEARSHSEMRGASMTLWSEVLPHSLKVRMPSVLLEKGFILDLSLKVELCLTDFLLYMANDRCSSSDTSLAAQGEGVIRACGWDYACHAATSSWRGS